MTRNNKSFPRVALIGRPNVGKSTLFNRLTGTRDALVDATPGLTRDRRYSELSWGNLTMQLIDTGGMDKFHDKDSMSRVVQEQCLKAVEESDLMLVILDAKEGVTVADREVINAVRSSEKPYVIAINKVDNPARELNIGEFFELGVNEITSISASHGRGIDDLMREVVRVLKGMDRQEDYVLEHDQGRTPEIEEDQPIRVAIIGRPNTGKSSLLNTLAGEPRMIVTDVPGTTRDAIDTLIKRSDRRDILLTDTAGIRRKAKVRDKIEKFSIIKAINAIKACDIALVVMNISEGITDQDKRLIGYTERYSRACITLFNKLDLVRKDQRLMKLRSQELQRAKRFIPYSPHLDISALTGRRVDRILPLIDQVYTDFSTSTNTGTINRVLQDATGKRNPPISRGHHLRLFYSTQVVTHPPTFLIFANYPDSIPSHYKRFLANQFRDQLHLNHTPIRILFRKRERR